MIVRNSEDLARFEGRWEETREEFEEVDLGIEGLEPSVGREPVPPRPPGLDAPNAEAIVASFLETPRSDGAWIVSLPCGEPAEVPARLLEGGDLCPPPEEHFEALRRWKQTHGAEPLLVGRDTLVLLVRPVQSIDEARRVAKERFAYCGDEGEEEAERFVGLPAWSFWWD